MSYQPIAAPLRQVLQTILNANLFAGWRAGLTRWEIEHAADARTLQAQIAAAALTDSVDPQEFLRLAGHWVTDQASTQAWFRDIHVKYYGRPPDTADIGP